MFSAAANKLMEIFQALAEWGVHNLIEPFLGLSLLKDLVFGTNDGGELVWATFKSSDLENGLNPLFYTMMTLAGFFLVALIVIYGMRIAGAPMTPQKRTDMFDFLKDMLFVGIILVNLPALYDLLFFINSAILSLFSGAYDSNIDDLMEMRSEELSGFLGFMLIQIVLVGLMIWANFYYLMRKVTLLILMGLGPLMITLWLNPLTKPITGAWFKELIGSIFVQSIHAFVFWTITVISSTSSGFIETVLLYIIFIPISESVRKLFGLGGDMQSGLSKAGAMMGMGALAGMYGSVKGALGDKSVMGALKGAYNGVSNHKGSSDQAAGDISDTRNAPGAKAGSDLGTSPKSERMLKNGEILSKAGKAVFGMAGSLGGSPMGPVGAMIGATGAAAVGEGIGGVVGRVGTGIADATNGLLNNRHKAGINAAGKIGKNDKGFGENFANEVADHELSDWTKKNKDSEMARLRELHPSASPQDLENKFNDIAKTKRNGFYKDAKAGFSSLSSGGSNGDKHISGNQLAETSSSAMANQWESMNKKKFMEDYDKNNPQLSNESNADYQNRRMNAFSDKKGEMKKLFAEKGHAAVSTISVDGEEPISKDKFVSNLKSALEGTKGLDNIDGLTSASNKALDHIQGANVLNRNGKGNSQYLAGRMANAKTEQMRGAFIADQTNSGVPIAEAERNWNAQLPAVHRENLQMYAASADTANNLTVASGMRGKFEKLGSQIAKGSAYMVGASGVQDAVSIGKNIIQTGVPLSTEALVDGSTSLIDSHAKFQSGVGYAAGMAFGRPGYQLGKSLGAKLSPYNSAVQEQIYTPTEAMQMAQTVTDDNGNKTIASGAIRQVTTPNESYIEVRTKSGNSQIVSRKSAGHSGLNQGDTVYQDLEMQGDQLVPVQSKSGSSTYRIDSGGGRIPSSVQIQSNPNELLASPIRSSVHQPSRSYNVPSYSEKVDSGQFYIEDLESSGFENMQVIVEKDRQFVTGSKDGMTYRVSPVYAGDSRLSSNDNVQIPVSIKQNKLSATRTPGSQVAVQANYSTVMQEGYENYSETPDNPYYSGQEVRDLIVSRDVVRAQKSISKRQNLETVRRKQGILG